MCWEIRVCEADRDFFRNCEQEGVGGLKTQSHIPVLSQTECPPPGIQRCHVTVRLFHAQRQVAHHLNYNIYHIKYRSIQRHTRTFPDRVPPPGIQRCHVTVRLFHAQRQVAHHLNYNIYHIKYRSIQRLSCPFRLGESQKVVLMPTDVGLNAE